MNALEKRIDVLEDAAEVEEAERELAEFAALSDSELDERIPGMLDRACETHNADPAHVHPHDVGEPFVPGEVELKDRIVRRMNALGYKTWHDASNMARWSHEQTSNAT